jgi:hypothetical protein
MEFNPSFMNVPKYISKELGGLMLSLLLRLMLFIDDLSKMFECFLQVFLALGADLLAPKTPTETIELLHFVIMDDNDLECVTVRMDSRTTERLIVSIVVMVIVTVSK